MDADRENSLTMTAPQEIICETDRLWLVPYTQAYVEELIPMFEDAEVCRFIGGTRMPEEVRPRLMRLIDHYRLHGFSRWAVIHKETRSLMGWSGPLIFFIDGVAEVEVGYTLRRPWWGHGFATEAVEAAIAHARDKVGLRRMVSLIHPQNHRSLRVAAKLGSQPERMTEWHGEPTHLFRIPDPPKTA